jgi:hypothetical protein
MSSQQFIDNNNSTSNTTPIIYSYMNNIITILLSVCMYHIVSNYCKSTPTPTPAPMPATTPTPAPAKPVPCSFTCPGCNNSYPDRVKYGKEMDGAWFCNSTCNTIYNTRQKYANMNPGPSMFPYNSNLATVHPLHVVAKDGVVKFIF